MNNLTRLVLTIAIISWTNVMCATPPDTGKIKGKILLSEEWEQRVYLSFIPEFNERFTISGEMIIEEATITEQGHFEFSTAFLPKEEGLYRIHAAKVGYPRATLTIGGKAQNFHFLFAKKDAMVELFNTDSIMPFQSIAFLNPVANHHITWVDNWVRFSDSSHFAGTMLKKELINQAIHEKLRLFADSTEHFLSALYALHNSNFEKNIPVNSQYYERFLNQWESENSSYQKEFASHFKPLTSAMEFGSLWIGLLCFAFGATATYYWLNHNSKAQKNPGLSVQEQKILKLLQAGKSNKEISEECNIGVSTVKSHASSIYAKMKIKSRKELFSS